MNKDIVLEFLESHQKDWQRISRHTRGEYSPGDVQNEAWLMLDTLQKKGFTLDLRRRDHQSLLISHLYQHLVRYTELNVRHAIRLDHSPSGEAGEAHPLTYLLAADEQYDPVVALINAEDQKQLARERHLSAHQSLAAAYCCLLERFNNQVVDVANHLMISPSYCYRRCAHAALLAIHQQALPAAAMVTDPDFVPGPWRHFRLWHTPVQLSLDFDSDRLLFADER